tara:strand:- start:2181 stop:3278 length:1098 start_codon:yes stop_codon:yes gene_type:complete
VSTATAIEGRPWKRFALGILLSTLLLSGLFVTLDLKPSKVWDALAQLPPASLLLIVAVHLIALIAKVKRWGLLLAGSDCQPQAASADSDDPALRHLVQDSVFLGWLGNLLLPAKSGELVRPLIYSRRSQLPFPRILSTVVLERSFDLLVIALLFWTSVFLLQAPSELPPSLIASSRLAGLASLLLVVGLVVLWKMVPADASRMTKASGWAEQLNRGLLHFRQGLASFRRPQLLMGVLGWSLLSWSTEVVGAWLCLKAFALQITSAWAAACLHVVATTLAVSVVPVPGGLGVEQPVTLAVFAPFFSGSLPAEELVAISLVLSFASIFWVAPLGLLGMWRQGARLNAEPQPGPAIVTTAGYETPPDD